MDPEKHAVRSKSRLHGEHHEELSADLIELKTKPTYEQGAFWQETAMKLAPFAIGKSAGLSLDYDVLGRYFNGTSMGLDFIFDKVKNTNDGLDQNALAEVLVTHFGILANYKKWEEALSNENFLSLCQLLGAHDGAKASRASVRFAVRRLRIGSLLHMGLDHQDLYHYDYDDKICEGSFRKPTTYGGLKNQRVGAWTTVAEAEIEGARVQQQKSMMSPDDLDSGDEFSKRVHEYLFRNPQEWPGKVHWVHAHKPAKFLVLALGQQHHLRIHAQGILSRLQATHTQHNFGTARSWQDSGSPDWFLMTFPAVVLDNLARRSLQNFHKWKNIATIQARGNDEIPEPPPVHVGVVTYQAALLWSAPHTHDTVISMAGESEYIGKWTNEVHAKSFWSWLPSSSCCNRKRRRKDGYEELPQDIESDLEKEASLSGLEDLAQAERSLKSQFHLKTSEIQAAQEGTFEHIFEDILLLLAESNSLLRMGTHAQLACRILLSWTSAHVEVLQLYEAAIVRMQHYLSQKDHPDKEVLISKISMAKLEISTLIRKLDPFIKYVMPDLHKLLSQGDDKDHKDVKKPQDLSQVIRMHHLVDIENNLRQVMQELESQRNLCDSIIGEYDRKSADKVNNILNFLTIITFLVMPVQILTGIYGMNFKVMPELKWEMGYPYGFLFMSFIGTSVFATFLCVYKSMI